MSGQTLRSLVVSVSAETSAYQREMARASRMGQNYLRTIGDGNRQAAAGWRAQQAAIVAQNGALDALTSSAGDYVRTIAAALVAGNAVALADEWGQVASRLKMATDGQEEYLAVQAKLMEISDRTFKRYGDQAELFITTSKTLREMGYATEAVTGFVDVLASGLTVSAADGEKTAAVIKAVGEAIAIGKLQGDQWQQVLTKAPAIVTALGDALGVTQAELANLARNGELVTSKWLPALISKQEELAQKTEDMPTTLADAYVRLSNHYAKWLGDQNDATGATQALAEMVNVLADNLDLLAVAAVAGGAAYIAKSAAEGARSVLAEVQAVRAATSASIGRAAAQLDVASATARRTQAEVIAAQAQAQATRWTDAHTAALSRLRLARLADREATLAQTAAQVAYNRASALAGRAVSGVMGLLGGPAGLALLAASTAAGFLLFADNADKANAAAVDLARPIADLRREWEGLSAAQRRPVLNALVQQQAEAKTAAAAALAEIRALAKGPDKWGDQYAANPFARDRAAGSFGRDIAAGIDVDAATQDLIEAIGPSAELREQIEGWAASYAEAVRNGSAAGNQIAELTGILEAGAGAAGGMAAGLKGIESLSPDMAKAWETRIGQLTEQAAKLADASALGEVNRKAASDGLEATAEGRALAVRARAAAEQADATERNKKAAEEAARLAKQRTDEAVRAAKALQDNYQRTLKTLQEQTAQHGQSTELAKVKYLTTQGELAALTAAQKVELERAAAAKDVLDAQQSYKSLMEGVKSQEERLVSQLRERVRLLDAARAAGGVNPDEYDAARAKISKSSITQAPKFGGLDAAVGGAAGELVKVAEAQKELEKWRAEELARQRTFLDEKLISEQLHAERVAEITQESNARLADLGSAHKVATLGMFADLTGNAADMMGELAGKGSAAYKALFLASKAAAIAQAVVSTEVAAAKALELGPIFGIPASSLIRGLGYASVGMIAATSLAGMAHDGIDSVPREGTWLLDKGERVVDGRTNGDLKNFLARTRPANDAAVGGGQAAPVKVDITIMSDGSSEVATQPGLEQFGRELGEFVERKYRQLLGRDLQQGGAIWRAKQNG